VIPVIPAGALAAISITAQQLPNVIRRLSAQKYLNVYAETGENSPLHAQAGQ
jgi:hypothetical protein